MIRHVACVCEGDLFATAEFESRVEVWSLGARERVAAFATILDFGGKRLGFTCAASPKLVAGAYNRYGVRAYDLPSGEEVWRRGDLKQVQFVRGTRYGVAVGVGRGPLRLLDSETGEVTRTLRGVSKLYDGPHGLALVEGISGRIEILDLEHERRVWHGRIDGFAVLDAAVGADAIAVAEAGAGTVSCLELDGATRWKWKAPDGEHVLRLAWLPDGQLAAILHRYEASPSANKLLVFDAHGALTQSTELPRMPAFEFSADGTYLVASVLDGNRSSRGTVLAVLRPGEEWEFRAG